jgi:heme exporter protein D
MIFASFGEFLHMGGHWPYVWSAYGLTAIVLALNVVVAVRGRQQFFLRQRREAARAPGRGVGSDGTAAANDGRSAQDVRSDENGGVAT